MLNKERCMSMTWVRARKGSGRERRGRRKRSRWINWKLWETLKKLKEEEIKLTRNISTSRKDLYALYPAVPTGFIDAIELFLLYILTRFLLKTVGPGEGVTLTFHYYIHTITASCCLSARGLRSYLVPPVLTVGHKRRLLNTLCHSFLIITRNPCE